jgi:hypothetical protein
MSLIAIEKKMFNKSGNLSRRATTLDDIGDFTETWSDIVSGVEYSLQPLNTKEKLMDSGNKFLGQYKIYSNVSAYSVIPLENDKISDIASGVAYIITDVQKQESSFGGHHYKFFAKRIDNNS